MTKRIYIRGNLGMPRDLYVYDADTAVQLDDVTKVTLESDVSGVVQASLRRTNHPITIVDVVPGPPPPYIGQMVYRMSLDADRRASHCDTIHVAKVTSLIVAPDGTLTSQGGQIVSMHHAVSDTEVANAFDPNEVLDRSADNALTSVIRAAIILPLKKLLHGTRPRQTGGVVKSKLPPDPGCCNVPKKADPRPKCPECFDTGLTNGLIHPCSKGCPIK